MFHCLEGGYVSVKFIYDGNIDCPSSKSDEELCICNAYVTSINGAKNICVNKYCKECHKISVLLYTK